MSNFYYNCLISTVPVSFHLTSAVVFQILASCKWSGVCPNWHCLRLFTGWPVFCFVVCKLGVVGVLEMAFAAHWIHILEYLLMESCQWLQSVVVNETKCWHLLLITGCTCYMLLTAASNMPRDTWFLLSGCTCYIKKKKLNEKRFGNWIVLCRKILNT